MVNIFDVAGYILEKCGEMPTMKLQRLLYCCQGWNLACTGEELFSEDFYAEAIGPVCPEFAEQYKGKFRLTSADAAGLGDGSPLANMEILDTVLAEYADRQPFWLYCLVKGHIPWLLARHECEVREEGFKAIISKDALMEYHRYLLGKGNGDLHHCLKNSDKMQEHAAVLVQIIMYLAARRVPMTYELVKDIETKIEEWSEVKNGQTDQ